MVCVRIPPKLIICCYYRPHVSMPNINGLSEILGYTYSKYPGSQLLFVGDMNFPGIDWTACKVKSNTQYKAIHHQFIHMLNENNLYQVILEPTYIHGNTLDLICTNDPSIVNSTEVISVMEQQGSR